MLPPPPPLWVVSYIHSVGWTNVKKRWGGQYRRDIVQTRDAMVNDVVRRWLGGDNYDERDYRVHRRLEYYHRLPFTLK